MFDAAVNSNPNLSGGQKFNYLRAQLHGDAAHVIAGFPLTNDNYSHSVTLLKDKFGQSYKLINAHMDALFNLGKPSNNLPSLQAFHDSIEKHTGALSSLGQTSDTYGSLLTTSILNKLPVEVKKHMAHEHCNSEWSIDDVMASILKEIQIFEMSQQYTVKFINRDTTIPTTDSFHTSIHKTSRSHHSHEEKLRRESVCVFSKGDHKTIKCSKVVDPKERLAVVRQENLCFNCLAKNTRLHNSTHVHLQTVQVTSLH